MRTTKGFVGSCFAGEREPLEVSTLVGLDERNYVQQINKTNLSLSLFCDTSFNGNTCTLDVAEFNGINVVFCGEAYNCDELCKELDIDERRRSNIPSSHVAGLLYRKYGIEFASKINGMFSIILWDGKSESLHLYADRFGSAFPVYYHLSRTLAFSSQLKLLLQYRHIKKEIDTSALALFLKYSYVPSSKTIIRGIEKLGPGEVLTYKRGTCKRLRYINFETKAVRVFDEKEAIERYIEVLTNSIQRKMKGFDSHKIGFFLSGGMDSSANIALASLCGDKMFKSIAIGFDDPELDERPCAHLVAKHFGVEFLDYVFDGSEIEDLPRMVWHLDEPFMENGLFLTYAGFKAAKDHADLIIAGDGTDQLFGTGGFAEGRPIALRYLLDRLHCRALVANARRCLLNPFFYRDNFLFKAKVMIDRAVDFNDWFFWGFDDNELKKLCNFPITKDDISCFSNHMGNILITLADYYQYALIHQDVEHYVCQNIMTKSYRMAQLFGINLREVYLDNNVIDFLLPLRTNLKTKGNFFDFLRGTSITKHLHRLAMKDILPMGILEKPKQGGFIRMALLLSDAKRRKCIFTYLLRSEVLCEYFDMEYIEMLVTECENSLTGKMYWQPYQDNKVNQLMNLLVFSLWHHFVLNNNELTPPKCTLSQFIGP